MAKLRIRNEKGSLQLLFLEPIGVDYWLRKGDEFAISQSIECEEPFCVDLTDDGITVWANCGDWRKAEIGDVHVTDRSGARLAIGHQRPGDTFPDVPRPPTADPAP